MDSMKQRQYLKLIDELKSQEVNVIRGQYGLAQPCKSSEVVVGDIITIEPGMRIPADCILLDGMDVTVDESVFNGGRGENIIAKKFSKGEEHHRENPDPFLLAQTLVSTGTGRAVVCAVGKHTRYFTDFPPETFEEDDTLTPLQ
jgi:P-type E1-E2 ATPase